MNASVRKNVLLVDDSRTVRQLIRLVMGKHMTCDFTEAEDGLDAVTKLREGEYDLVITDINMPNMNGLTLIGKIRGELALDVPIIIVTTMGMEADRDRGLQMGANSYITKPIQPPGLLREAAGLLS